MSLEPLAALRDEVRALAQRDPIDTLVTVVLGSAYLFYLAEKGKNPKVKTFYDALIVVSTSLSVGHADIFPKTDAGKAIASFVMTFGPSLSTRALDPKIASPAAPALPTLPT
jgi:voltage-gated potassium channel